MQERRRSTNEVMASALASGVRLRLMRISHNEALTNKELASRLGRDPATTLYHVRKLVKAGFLKPEAPRRGKRGSKEIPYRSTGLPWVIGPRNNRLVAEAMIEAYLAEVGELEMADVAQIRFVLDLTPGRRQEFERRLEVLLDEFDHDAVQTDSARTAIFMAMYPSI
jgi:DNA-binding Lrp family transcriptional regulator